MNNVKIAEAIRYNARRWWTGHNLPWQFSGSLPNTMEFAQEVQAFQLAHGLPADGKLGPDTEAAARAEKPSPTPDEDRLRPWRGVGMWLWQMSKCGGGDFYRIAARLGDAGIFYALVKIADGRSPMKPNVAALSPLKVALDERGIGLGGWAWVRHDNPEAEAELAARLVADHGLDSFVVNAEKDTLGQHALARRYMARLREKLPAGVPVALSSYKFPKAHPTLPWREYLDACDAGMPQVYLWGSKPSAQVARSAQEWGAYGKPIIPTGPLWPKGGATPETVGRFIEDQKNAVGVNFWDYQHATDGLWAALQTRTHLRPPSSIL